MDPSLLDTDIFSEILKGKNPRVSQNARAYREHFGQYTLSAVTVVEIIKGFQRLGRDAAIQTVIGSLDTETVLSLDLKSALTAGRIYGDLERSGQTVGRADPMIAAIAIEHSLVLVTGNTAHFERIQRLGYPLRLDNWRETH